MQLLRGSPHKQQTKKKWPPTVERNETLVNDGDASHNHQGKEMQSTRLPRDRKEVKGQRDAPKERQKRASAEPATAEDKTVGRGRRDNRVKEVKNYSLGNMEQAPSRSNEASPQSGLGVGCKLCSSRKSCAG